MLKSAFSKFTRKINIRTFADIVPKTDNVIIKPSTLDALSDISKQTLGMNLEEIKQSRNIGADLILTPEKKEIIQRNSFFFKDKYAGLNLDEVAHKGWKLKYLKNMNLLYEYSQLFREFLQNCARYDSNGLKRQCEPTLLTFILRSLNETQKQGYQIEIESLTLLKYDFSVLRLELYKNLYIDRSMNGNYDDYIFSKTPTPLGTLVNARIKNEDNNSIAKNQKPFILATTMLIKTPIKVAIYNQNMTRKIYGENENGTIDYVVRFETEMSYSDFGWILPGPNKPSRLHSTKITDFNNVMRGNPYFYKHKWDLIDENERYRYMTNDVRKDEEVFFDLDLVSKF